MRNSVPAKSLFPIYPASAAMRAGPRRHPPPALDLRPAVWCTRGMGVDEQTIAEAHRLATVAAASAGVSVRMAEPRDLAGIIGLFERTWGVGRSPDRAMLL